MATDVACIVVATVVSLILARVTLAELGVSEFYATHG